MEALLHDGPMIALTPSPENDSHASSCAPMRVLPVSQSLSLTANLPRARFETCGQNAFQNGRFAPWQSPEPDVGKQVGRVVDLLHGHYKGSETADVGHSAAQRKEAADTDLRDRALRHCSLAQEHEQH